MGIYDSIIKDAQSAIDFNELEKFKLQGQKSNRELSTGGLNITLVEHKPTHINYSITNIGGDQNISNSVSNIMTEGSRQIQ
jgi:hypothetical protein